MAHQLQRQQSKLLEAHYAGAIPMDLLASEQDRLSRELTKVTNRLEALTADLTEVDELLTVALDLAEHCGDTYAAAPDHLRRLLNQTLFTQLRVTTNPDGIDIEPEFNPPYGILFDPETRSTIAEVFLATRHAEAAAARRTPQRKKPVQMDGLQGLAESDPALFSSVIASTKSTVVGVLGAYSKTKVTTGQVRSLLEKARAERLDREPTVTKVRTPKELPGEVQSAIVDGYRSGASMKELARVFGVHRTTIRAALDRQGAPVREHAITSAQVATAARLYESGLSLAVVGEKLGFNAQTIATHLRRAGVSLRDPHGRAR